MQNELPKTLTLVLVENRYSLLKWLLYCRPVLQAPAARVLKGILFLFVALDQTVQIDRLVVLGEVHKAVQSFVVDLQIVIVVYWVSFVLVAAMRANLPHHLGGELLADFDCECPVPRVCCLHDATQVRVGLNMPENYIGTIHDRLPCFELQGVLECFYLSLRSFFEHFSLL